MNGHSAWSYAPYLPFDRKNEALLPYICRLAPYENFVEIEWFDKGAENEGHTLCYSVRSSGEWHKRPVSENIITIHCLEIDTEYEIFIEREDGVRSNTRLVRTGSVLGTVINYLHPEDPQYSFVGQYLCSPSIVRLDSGALIASMDIFQKDGPRNLSLVFRSEDDGESWHYLTDLFPCFWGTPFVHNGQLYMLSVSNKYGDLLLGYSDDSGETWSTPVALMRGSCLANCKGFHRAPMPVIKHSGRIWVSLDFGGWESAQMDTTLVSIDENADLTVAENWVFSEPLPHDKTWENALNIMGGLEGNAIPAPDGNIVTMLRYNDNKALVLKSDVSDPHKQASFVKILDFPMGHTKFEVRRHPSGKYYAIGNTLPGRNVLAMYVSNDLENWTFERNIADYSHMSVKTTAFQYPDFMFNGENEILLVSRTALNGADNFHNNNYVTFHRVKI